MSISSRKFVVWKRVECMEGHVSWPHDKNICALLLVLSGFDVILDGQHSFSSVLFLTVIGLSFMSILIALIKSVSSFLKLTLID
jgi:hypothetical protein